LPQINAVTALTRLQESELDIPFIIVSASIDEDVAVAAMRQGAADYILKDRLALEVGVQCESIWADRKLLQQILTNLLTNAIRAIC
jgi:DNA-binding NtrC family response regulator